MTAKNSIIKPIKNFIRKVIANKETETFRFTPTQDWYESIEVGKKEFGMFLRNERQPTLTQLQSIAEKLECTIDELIDKGDSETDDLTEIASSKEESIPTLVKTA